MIFIGIDPGKHGGVAVVDEIGNVIAVDPIPETDSDLFELLFNHKAAADADHDPVFAVLECVRSSPQMGVKSAFTFGCVYGAVKMALTAARIPCDEAVPRRWQPVVGVVYPPKATYTARKNISKARAQQVFPGHRITHATADALLIAEYCRRTRVGA